MKRDWEQILVDTCSGEQLLVDTCSGEQILVDTCSGEHILVGIILLRLVTHDQCFQ
jgi:hypothetical protein